MRALVVVVLISSCQQYEFNRVEPITYVQTQEEKIYALQGLRPDFVMLLDRSGSMAYPLSVAAPTCGGCSLGGCPATCPTRLSELRQATTEFFNSPSRSIARWGLAVFPASADNNSCGGTSTFLEPLPEPANDDAQAAAWDLRSQAIAGDIERLASGGGTPTAESLRFVKASFEGEGPSLRQRYVVLLTDGVPNCNDTNANNLCSVTTPEQVAKCACTTGGGTCTGAYCAKGCLDTSVSQVVRELASENIETFVIGFGADTNQESARVILNDLARAGRRAHTCTKDADCGAGDRCESDMVCSHAYFQVSNGTELANALHVIVEGTMGACELALSQESPVDPRYITLLDGHDQSIDRSLWSFAPPGHVTYLGALCEAVKASTPAMPVTVKIRYVQAL